MKILSATQIRQADNYTIENEPISSIDLMERASKNLVDRLIKLIDPDCELFFCCGPGNNGGDGLAMARLLSHENYKCNIILPNISENYSDDFNVNLARLKETDITIYNINSSKDFIIFSDDSIVIDCIFGSGLDREIIGLAGEFIQHINNSNTTVISVDIPSGLYCDKASEGQNIIQADYTFSFQFAKQAFLFKENHKYTGNWEIIDIGLHKDFIENINVDKYFVDIEFASSLIKAREKFDYKGTYGHACIIAGSKGMAGAAFLSSKAALKSGCGLVSVHSAAKVCDIIQTNFPEAMVSYDKNNDIITEIPNLNYNAVCIGPGMGKESGSRDALKSLIQSYDKPIVFDADAINILADNPTYLAFLPPNSILTPHIGEFERLVGKTLCSFEREKMQLEFSRKYNVYVVLKGPHTSISSKTGFVYYNNSGNNAMATAGSGDVLSGIITSLLAQKYPPIQACILGVFAHGLAGEKASKKLGLHSTIATDIIENIRMDFSY